MKNPDPQCPSCGKPAEVDLYGMLEDCECGEPAAMRWHDDVLVDAEEATWAEEWMNELCFHRTPTHWLDVPRRKHCPICLAGLLKKVPTPLSQHTLEFGLFNASGQLKFVPLGALSEDDCWEMVSRDQVIGQQCHRGLAAMRWTADRKDAGWTCRRIALKEVNNEV